MLRAQVSTEFLLMGFISEEPASKTGFYGSGITLDKVRAAVEALQDPNRPADGRPLSGPQTQDLPFSHDAKRVFETAAAVRAPSRVPMSCVPGIKHAAGRPAF